jgi:hypothetical protein
MNFIVAKLLMITNSEDDLETRNALDKQRVRLSTIVTSVFKSSSKTNSIMFEEQLPFLIDYDH